MKDEKMSRVLQEIRKDKAMEDYFFTKLSSTSNPFKWLKILKEQNYFDPKNNPHPKIIDDKKGLFVVPYWNVLGYLENLSKQLKIKPDDEITKQLVEIVNSIIEKRVENYRTDWMLIKTIFNLPIECITENYIKFIRTALLTNTVLVSNEILATVLPYLIEKKAKERTLELLKILIDFKKEASPFSQDYVSVLDNYWLEEILNKFQKKIFELCGIDSAYTAISKIEEILNQDGSRFSFSSVNTIEDSPQNLSHNTYERLCISFLRNSLIFEGPEKIKGLAKNLLNNKYPIFQRLALHLIDVYYSSLKELFWEIDKNLLENFSLTHELYKFFENQCEKFSDGEIERLVDWIEKQDIKIPRELETKQTEKEKFIAFRKKYWLTPLLNCKKEAITRLYEKYDKENPEKIEHPGYLIWFSGVIEVPPPHPLTEEFTGKTNQEIVRYLTEHGEAESFQVIVRRNPRAFSKDMKPFLMLSTELQAALITGLLEAWRAGENFQWNEVLDFLISLAEEKKFWLEDFNEMNYRDWLVRNASELIEIGCRDENHTFDAGLLPKCEKILLAFIKEDKSTLGSSSDILAEVLNSPKAAIFSAIISYSQKSSRLNKQMKLNDNIKNALEPFIIGEPRHVEVFLTMGLHLTAIYALDGNWVAENLSRIFPKDNETLFKAAMTGYLFGSSIVYYEIFQLLKTNNVYQKALGTPFENKSAAEMLVGHILVGYLNDFEKLEDKTNLVNQLVTRSDPKQFLAIVRFFSPTEGKLTHEQKKKIVPLWKEMMTVLIQKSAKAEFHEVLIGLNNWINLLDELNTETADLLSESVKYIKFDYQAIFLMKGLLRFVNTAPKLVGDIFLVLTNSDVFITYEKENVESLVKTLYEKNEKSIADEICHLYTKKGLFFLEELYDSYNADDEKALKKT
jgi:hypothetical protein